MWFIRQNVHMLKGLSCYSGPSRKESDPWGCGDALFSSPCSGKCALFGGRGHSKVQFLSTRTAHPPPCQPVMARPDLEPSEVRPMLHS